MAVLAELLLLQPLSIRLAVGMTSGHVARSVDQAAVWAKAIASLPVIAL